MKTTIVLKIYDPMKKDFLVRIKYARLEGGFPNSDFVDYPISRLDDLAFVKKFFADKKAVFLSNPRKVQARLKKDARAAETRTLVTSFGLQNDGVTVITPTKIIGGENHNYVVPAALMERYAAQGSLKGWKAISEYLEMSSILTFGICVAFAAPLLTLFDRESFGFLLSGKRKGGKSTAIRACASVAGYSSKQRLKTFDFTETGGEEEAQAHSGIAWPLDDLEMKGGSAKERHAAIEHFSYKLANGAGKVRARQAVASGIVSDSYWQTISLTGAENTASSVARAAGTVRQGGAAARLVDIPFELHIFDRAKRSEVNVPALCAAIAKIGRENSGKPLNAFLRRFFDERQKNEARIRHFEGMFVERARQENDDQGIQHLRQYFAFIYAVGAVASELGVLPVSRTHVRQSAMHCYQKAVDELDPGRKFVSAGLKLLRNYCKTVKRVRKSSPLIGDDDTGFKRSDGSSTYLIVSREYFLKMFPNAMQAQLVAKHLAAKGWLRMPAPEHLPRSLDWASQQISWPTESNSKKRVNSLVIELEDEH